MTKKSLFSANNPAFWVAVVIFLTWPVAHITAAPLPWVEKTIEPTVTVAGQVYPTGCAFQDPATSTFRYRYFIQGNGPNLLILLDGGGACWDPNTCGLNAPTQPVFFPFITESVSNQRLVDAGPRPLETGILADDTHNPFQNYTKVFVPYCTGDLFWGNRDTHYGPVITRHRGYGNLMGVIKSLWSERSYASAPPDKVVITGTSAGAYGAIAAFIEIERRLPKWLLFNNTRKTLTYLIADGGNGIVTNDFLDRAINAPDAAWGVRAMGTLPNYLLDALQEASGLPVAVYRELTWRYPKSRFAQIQSAYDAVQVSFLNTMKYVDEPSRWQNPEDLLPSMLEWATQMRWAVNLSAMASNYRYYTSAGSDHTVLIDVPPEAGFGFCSDLFYQQNSAAGIRLVDWVRDMVNTPSLWWTGQWRNATCFPVCTIDTTSRCPISLNP